MNWLESSRRGIGSTARRVRGDLGLPLVGRGWVPAVLGLGLLLVVGCQNGQMSVQGETDVDSEPADSSEADGVVSEDDGTSNDEDTASPDTGPPPMDADEPGDADAGDRDGPHPLVSVRGTSQFERDVSPPECDASRSEVEIIDENSDWDAINDDSHRIFCVKPGDYTDRGEITISSSGSEGERRYLLFDRDAHPIDLDNEDRARVERLDFDDGASHWTVQGLTAYEQGETPVMVRSDADRIVFDRLLVAGGPGKEIAKDSLAGINGDYVTVQNSVLRNAKVPGGDRLCIGVHAPGDDSGVVRGTRVVSNEMYDCTDGVQLVITSSETDHLYPETLIAHNDMYISQSEKFRTEDGEICAENAIDIKGGGTGPDERVRVIGNRMWGYSTGADCGGSGTGAFASAAGSHNVDSDRGGEEPPKHLTYRNNIFFKAAQALSSQDSEDVRIENNLFHNTGDYTGLDGRTIALLGSSNNQIVGNTLHDSHVYLDEFYGAEGTFEENVFLDAGEGVTRDASISTDRNAYFGDTDPLEDDPWIEESSVDAAEMREFCVTLRGYTDPREKCFPEAISTEESPQGRDVGFRPPEGALSDSN